MSHFSHAGVLIPDERTVQGSCSDLQNVVDIICAKLLFSAKFVMIYALFSAKFVSIYPLFPAKFDFVTIFVFYIFHVWLKVLMTKMLRATLTTW